MTAVAVADEAAAREIWVAADTLGTVGRLPDIVIARELFDPPSVTAATRSGTRISGTEWTPDER